jgi:ribonucleoside-diphosphate reductase beta chain
MKGNLFFGEPVTIARYDKQKHPIFEKLTRQQIGYFWVPEEVDTSKDGKDFRSLPKHEQHIFTANLKRQIVLDTKQGVSPSLALLPLASLPEIETWIQTWAFFETIHSRSYTHIIRDVYADPSVVFDEILNIPEIAACSADISKYYDALIELNNRHAVHGVSRAELYEHKRAFWLCLMSINVLEGIRFYVSFCCSWSFAEQKKLMEGNAKIIKFICRDENLHLASTQHLLKILPKEDPDFAQIALETQDECVKIFEDAVKQEEEWADYLFKDGSMLGLNAAMLKHYVEWLANKRMTSIGLPTKFKGGTNPLPWTQKWIAGSEVQVAPQQTVISSYTTGGVNKDVTATSFQGFRL